jgi:hypothetical protein
VDLPAGWEVDMAYRAVTALPARNVDAYGTFDLRVGQKISDRVQWSLVGQNLAQPHHLEFSHDPPPAVAVRRSVYASITWSR